MSNIPPENPYAAKLVDYKPEEPARTSRKAIASLVLGLLTPVFCVFTGLPGAILGFMGLSDINRSGGRLKGSGLAISGIVFSLVSSFALAPLMIMVLLLLPAVNAAREAARRNGCINNMRSLSLGVMNHEAATKRFPVASMGSTDLLRAQTVGGHGEAPAASDDGFSWQYQMLPYVEENLLYDEMRRSASATENFTGPFDARFTSAAGEPFANTRISLFVCPSYSGDTVDAQPAVGNYCAYVGTDVGEGPAAPWKTTPNWENGALPSGCHSVANSQTSALSVGSCQTRGIGLRDLGDGISKTIIAVESREPIHNAWISGASMWAVAASPNSLAFHSTAIAQSPDDNFIALLQNNGRESTDGAGLALNFGNYNSSSPPAEQYLQASDWATGQDRQWGPSSEHAGNVTIHVFADAHAQAISAEVDPTTYLRFITRNDGDRADEMLLE